MYIMRNTLEFQSKSCKRVLFLICNLYNQVNNYVNLEATNIAYKWSVCFYRYEIEFDYFGKLRLLYSIYWNKDSEEFEVTQDPI